MDFLSALREAQTLGLSTDEFRDIWTTEWGFKIAMQSQQKKAGNCCVAKTEASATLVDLNGHSSSVDLQRVEEYNRHFLSKFQNMCDLLVGKQEEQWKQLQHKHDETMEEFRSRFSLLSGHISNVVDCNTNSMKVYIMQELGLFQQDLEQTIREQGINQRCESERSNMSTDIQKLAGADISVCRTSEALSSKDEVEKYGQSERSTTRRPLGTVQGQKHLSELNVHRQHTFQNGIPINTDEWEEGVKNITQLTDTKCINGKVDSNTITTNDVDVSNNLHNSPFPVTGFNATSVQCINAGSVEIKMSHARTTESEKKQSSSRSIFSTGSSLARRGSSMNSAKDSTDSPTGTVSESFIASPVFTMTVTGQNGVFLSPTICCSGVPCSVRVRGIFKAEGALHVSLYVLSSGHDGNHKWPLVLSDTGHVFHCASQRYTPVWQLPPTICQKPLSTNGAYVYSCAVCLTTTRGTYPNVTYKQLVSSQFIENDTLTMKCTLNAKNT